MKEKTADIDILEDLLSTQKQYIEDKDYQKEHNINEQAIDYSKRWAKAIETLMAENKELKEEKLKKSGIYEFNVNIEDDYIPKSKVEEIIEELRNDTCKIINRTYIPTISSKLFNNNREKYEPMLEARNILINALNKLQSLLGKE
ncbi:MAG: hypothetical protein UIM53_00980 [Acutalibacteraceae bacterium]|nr:hypothetical protein [Acutalibacteraceae bacterium]